MGMRANVHGEEMGSWRANVGIILRAGTAKGANRSILIDHGGEQLTGMLMNAKHASVISTPGDASSIWMCTRCLDASRAVYASSAAIILPAAIVTTVGKGSIATRIRRSRIGAHANLALVIRWDRPVGLATRQPGSVRAKMALLGLLVIVARRGINRVSHR